MLLLTLALGFLAWPYLPFSWNAPTASTPPPAEGAAVAIPPTLSPEATASAPQAPVVSNAATATPGPGVAPVSPTPARVLPLPDVPVRLRIPRIAVDAPIVGVGVLGNGELDAPHQPDQVGWFNLGPRPGEVGNALLDGHFDWISIAVFYYLGKLEKGDRVVVVDTSGNEHRFLVDWKELVPADKAPMAGIVGATDVPALTLITCGGQFNRTTGEYTHRWVVRAVAAPPRRPVGHPALAL